MFITVNTSMTDNVSLLSISSYVTCMLMERHYTIVVHFKYHSMLIDI